MTTNRLEQAVPECGLNRSHLAHRVRMMVSPCKRLAVWMAPAIDDVAVDRADAGRAATRGSTLALYCDAAMLPSTATPKAAPSSRVASFMADPAPARLEGTADMIAAVIGDIVNANPTTSGTRQTRAGTSASRSKPDHER